MRKFEAIVEIIGINPFVPVPEEILTELFHKAGKTKGAIPVTGTVNGREYKQNLVKYKGQWRLYINTTMLKNSPQRIGERIEVTIAYDTSDRTLKPHPKLIAALNSCPEAQQRFDALSPSLQKEIIRYILMLKTEESIDRNVQRAIDFLLGKTSFVGRKSPF
jgi:hypothetical protein